MLTEQQPELSDSNDAPTAYLKLKDDHRAQSIQDMDQEKNMLPKQRL